MIRRSRRLRLVAVAVSTAVSFSLALTGATLANAAPLKVAGTAAVVASVDGPGLLTIKVGRRTLPVRLAGIDLPAAGECGAEPTTQALRGLVARAPKRLSYALLDRGQHQYERDPSGRLFAQLSYRVRKHWRDLGSDLTRAGWARSGESIGLDATWPRRPSLPDGTPSGAGVDPFDPVRAPRGAWLVCGGRFHLPGGESVPATAPAAWNVDEFGVTRSIGTLTLSATLSPAETLTMRRLSELVPTEITAWWFGTCIAHVPSLQIWAWTVLKPEQRCGDAPVGQIRTAGPGAAAIARGGKVGDPLVSLKRWFPKLDVEATPETGLLNGDEDHVWAWQTQAEYRDNDEDETDADPGAITGLVTWQSPGIPDL